MTETTLATTPTTRPSSVQQTEPGPGLASVFGLGLLGRILSLVVAPTTMLTALLYYFGWSHIHWLFDYFGVDSSVLGLSTGDYVLRSADALFVPVTMVVVAGLLGLWGHTALAARLRTGPCIQVFRVLLPAMTIIAIILATGGLVSVFIETELNQHLVMAPMSLVCGALMLAYTNHLRRTTRARAAGRRGPAAQRAAVAEWALVFVLVGIGLFWAAVDYSAAVGTTRAHRLVAKLPNSPDVTVYSHRSLSLDAPGVRQTRCADPQAAYLFRYDGLKLVLRAGDQYLFLPQGWTPDNGVAILIPRSDALRLEFTPSSARSVTVRPTC